MSVVKVEPLMGEVLVGGVMLKMMVNSVKLTDGIDGMLKLYQYSVLIPNTPASV